MNTLDLEVTHAPAGARRQVMLVGDRQPDLTVARTQRQVTIDLLQRVGKCEQMGWECSRPVSCALSGDVHTSKDEA